MTLQSVTWRVDHDVDVFERSGEALLWLHEGFALCGLGEALRIADAAKVPHALRSIAASGELDRYGAGPVAFASLPYRHESPTRFVVPEVVFGRDASGARWLTWTGVGDTPEPDALVTRFSRGDTSASYPSRFAVSSVRPEAEWRETIRTVRDQLRAGVARKAVLARELTVDCDAPIPRRKILERLRSSFPTCFVFAVPSGETAWIVGASPELLVSRVGDMVKSQPMAGTTRRSADPQTDARLAALLLSSQKDRVEHQITIDVVHETLLPWCSYLDAETEPSIVSVANVHHLATYVEGRLSQPLPSALELAAALHPTPAICGHPRDAAAKLIDEHEQLERGAYAGAVGWVDHRGQGEWAVAIRLAEIEGAHARLFAGVGVVAESDPDAELEETRIKFEAMLSAIVRP